MSVIEVLATSAFVAGLVSALIGGAFAWWRDRDLEKFKSDLKAETFERQTRFARLHETRSDVVAKLYALIAIADERIKAAAQPKIAVPKVVGIPDTGDTLGRQAYDAHRELRSYWNLNRLVLSKEQAEKVDELLETMDRAAFIVSFIRTEGISNEFIERYKSELDELMEQMAAQKEALEENFRETLGAELES